MSGLLNFLYLYFHTYDITTEVVMIGLIFVLHCIFVFSKPERSYMMKVFYTGISFALLIMILHIALLGETIKMSRNHSQTVFNVLYFFYSLCYTGVQECLFIYHTQLSYKRRSQRKNISIMCVIFGIIWLGLLLAPLFAGTLIEEKNGVYSMSASSDVYILCSFLCAVLLGCVSFANRKDVSKVVFWGSAIFIPVEMVAIAAQYFFHTAFFICANFTLPFLIYFLLFHTNKYDELTGCQGRSAYRAYLRECIVNKKEFLQITVKAPVMESRNFAEIEKKVINVCNGLSHRIEKLDRRLRVYCISNFHYIIFCPVQDEFEGRYLRDRLIDILTEPVEIEGKYKKIPMNFLISKRYESIETPAEQTALLRLNEKKFCNLGIDQIIEVSEEDAKAYKRRAFIEKNLLDIKFKKSLDDERIVVFIQPIYRIDSDDFRTGESLMRLMIDGEMIYPDEFIPIAESSGCIHTLTRIMLYKVAKQTVLMKENSSFDALTVNVSTVEMIEPNVCEEFLGIIRRAGAAPENIRLEITESTMVMDYSRVIENINALNREGISFYLDDFGTGYSNLDRVISTPFKTIKFDKSLLYKAIDDKKTYELFKFLASFFKTKGYSLVVEGVETEVQKEFVKASGFDFIQGYLYSKPVKAEDAMKFFRKA